MLLNINEINESVKNTSEWCKNNFLTLNVDKTKELIFCFNKKQRDKLSRTHIDGEPVEIVSKYRYLGVVIDEKLNSKEHLAYLSVKHSKNLFYLRTLRKFNLSESLINRFYESTVIPVLSYAMPCWFPSSSAGAKQGTAKLVKKAQRIANTSKKTDCVFMSNTLCLKLINKILSDSTHPLHGYISVLPSGRRLNMPFIRTSKFVNSFLLHSIMLWNKSKSI